MCPTCRLQCWPQRTSGTCSTFGFAAAGFLAAALVAAGFFALTALSALGAFGFAAAYLGKGRCTIQADRNGTDKPVCHTMHVPADALVCA